MATIELTGKERNVLELAAGILEEQAKVLAGSVQSHDEVANEVLLLSQHVTAVAEGKPEELL